MHLSSPLRPLSGNALKCIAAVTMLIDHIGLMFFPQYPIFRIIGRLAFPIFAFMIAEGCHYTKNRLRYFLGIFLLGSLCQTVYLIFCNDTSMNILLTFSCAIPIIYLLQEWKARKKPGLLVAFAATIGFVYVLTRHVYFHYDFWGMMVPVLAALCYPSRGKKTNGIQHILSVILMMLGLLPVCTHSHPLQYYCLFTLPLLLMYSGKRGSGNFKYGFYLFYPLHLVALQAIAWLLM